MKEFYPSPTIAAIAKVGYIWGRKRFSASYLPKIKSDPCCGQLKNSDEKNRTAMMIIRGKIALKQNTQMKGILNLFRFRSAMYSPKA
jgi:hypothetical protein